MQDASAEFATAVGKGEVEWCEPLFLADWLDDGSVAQETPPAYIIEQFLNRESSSTWLRPDVGLPSYTHLGGSDSDYDIPGGAGYGRINFGAVNTSRAALIQAATEVGYIRISWVPSATLTGTGEALFDVVLAGDGTGANQYMAQMQVNVADSTIDLALIERASSVDGILAFSTDGLTYVAGHTYTVVAQLDTDSLFIRAKFWDASISREPVDWTLEDNLNSLIAGVGTYGGISITMPSGITTTTPFKIHITEFRLIDGSIDDLSRLIGQVVVSQDMDDGLPSEVSYVQDVGSVALDAALLAGRRGLRAVQYLSQYNPLSPLYGLPRDIAPITFDHGVVTSAGPERVRLFTGQMIDVALGRDQLGHLTAMSNTRLKLSELVQPPPFNRFGDLSATWAVSWAAYQCAVYAAPPPTSGGAWYAPLHGSLQPFLDSAMPTLALYPVKFPILFAGYYRDVGDGELETITYGDDPESAPAYIDGPYVAAPDLQYTSDLAVGVYFDFPALATPADGSDPYILSEAGPRGRFEFIVRGDDFDTTGPSGTDFTPATFILLFAQENQAGEGSVYCGINMSRQLRIEMTDGTASINANAGASLDLPTDGQWYKYGVAWDFVTETAYFYMQEPDGTEHTDSSTNSALDVTRLPATDEPFTPAEVQPFNTAILSGFLNPYIHSFLPFAELHITAGQKANPNTMPWIWQNVFSEGAIIKPSATRLRAIAEPAERDAWEYIGEFAQAEMAAIRIDELDRLLYLTPAYWAESDQQTAGQTLSTRTNVAELVPQVDPSKIRNMVRVNYREARFDPLYGPVYQSREVIALPPGESTLLIPLDVLATSVDTELATLPSSAQVDAGVSNFISGGWHTFFTINTLSDGTGTYYSGPSTPSTDPVVIQVDSEFTAGVVTVSIINRTGSVVYTANDNPEVPTINIGGIGMHLSDASVITSRASSITQRGVRGLPVDAPAHQRREDAQRLAQRLLNELAEPTPTIEGVRVFGDPRRQPGDLVEFEDATQTAIGGQWRILSVRHVIDQANYYQDVRLRKALSVGEWQTSGESRWGETLWGREGL